MRAKRVGADLGIEGVVLTQEFNGELNLDADFFCCNVKDTSKKIKDSFDVVFTSYGVLRWLADLAQTDT